MARNRGGQQGQQGQGQQRRQTQQSDPNRSMTIGTAKQYGYALINQDEAKLNDMTLYTSGTMGSEQSNISAFRKSGASKIKAVHNQGKKATVLFGNENGIACVGIFNVVDQGHVLGDWEVFLKA